MLKIDLNEALANLRERYSGIERYVSIISGVEDVDISKDTAFQKEFSYFFRVRRNASWKEIYYGLFESYKSDANLSFEKVLCEIYRQTGRIEASFSSKLIASLDPSMPIWDSIVLSKLQLVPPKGTDKELRIEKTIAMYESIVDWYRDFLKSEKAKEWICAFDKEFPEFVELSDVKKIDFILWGA